MHFCPPNGKYQSSVRVLTASQSLIDLFFPASPLWHKKKNAFEKRCSYGQWTIKLSHSRKISEHYPHFKLKEWCTVSPMRRLLHMNCTVSFLQIARYIVKHKSLFFYYLFFLPAISFAWYTDVYITTSLSNETVRSFIECAETFPLPSPHQIKWFFHL